MQNEALNVLGTPLVPCSYDPLTGFFRDGCCQTDEQDRGSHVICITYADFVPHSIFHVAEFLAEGI